jgi:hypothetical protein
MCLDIPNDSVRMKAGSVASGCWEDHIVMVFACQPTPILAQHFDLPAGPRAQETGVLTEPRLLLGEDVAEAAGLAGLT